MSLEFLEDPIYTVLFMNRDGGLGEGYQICTAECRLLKTAERSIRGGLRWRDIAPLQPSRKYSLHHSSIIPQLTNTS